jgi:hypothetical protein
MIRYKIIQDGDGSFVVRVSDEGDWSRISPRFGNEDEADAWIVEHGRGTEYTISRTGD